jgi:hypothetical protein
MAHDVFLSYSSIDKAAADSVCRSLEQEHICVWMAPRDILPGRDYDEEIVDAIDRVRVMVLILSSHADRSKHVKREVERADRRDVEIIPIQIEDFEPKKLAYFLGVTHRHLAYPGPIEQHLGKLVDAVKPFFQSSDASAGAGISVSSFPLDAGDDFDSVEAELARLLGRTRPPLRLQQEQPEPELSTGGEVEKDMRAEPAPPRDSGDCDDTSSTDSCPMEDLGSSSAATDCAEPADRRDEPSDSLDHRLTDESAHQQPIGALDSLTLDLARIVDHQTATKLWEEIRRGEPAQFGQQLYTSQGRHTFAEIRRRYVVDADFRSTVDHYISEFERLLKETGSADRDGALRLRELVSDAGKVYTVLGHASGRLR